MLIYSGKFYLLNILYLYKFKYQRYEIQSYGIPLSLLSNATSMTKFGFFKGNLCPISHDVLIMDWLSRANLYIVPHVIALTFNLENDIQDTTFRETLDTFYKIQIRCL